MTLPDVALPTASQAAQHHAPVRARSLPHAQTGALGPADVLRLPHEPRATSAARRHIRAALANSPVPDAVVDDIEIVVSELFGNAVRHARSVSGGVLLFDWLVADGTVSVFVTDGGSSDPVSARHDGPMADSGRGLQIVDLLARTWGVTELPGGLRTVWASIALPGRSVGAGLRLVG